MNIWPFTSRKSYDQVDNPLKNTLLKALYSMQMHSGVAQVMDDNSTAYIKQGYSGNSDVYSIINRIIRMSSQARLALYTLENGKWIEITDHELVKFIKQVNPTMKTSDFIQGHLIYKLSIGNSYWYKPLIESGVNKGKTNEVWLMPSNNVEILAGKSWMNPVGGYRLVTNSTIEFNDKEVCHAKFFNPLFGEYGSLYGQSPLKAAAETVSKQNQAEITELKQFENQSPPYLLYRDVQDAIMGGLNGQQLEEVQDLFKDYNKKYKSGHPLVLPDKFGMLNLGISPADLKILESSQEGRRILCNIYGIPSELFNDKSSATYNNVSEAKKDAWNNCIKPNLNDFADDMTSFLIASVPAYANENLFFAFDYSDVGELQADRAVQVQWMRQAYWTPNQILEATGQLPVDNPYMNEPWMGMGESPLSVLTAPTEPLPIKDFGDYDILNRK